MILGVDEVGRGPWAGPLVVGAVVLGDAIIEDLNDSKKLTKKRRAELDEQIREKAAYGLGWVHPEELDQIGLAEALKVATIRAVESITVPYHEIIIDGTINFLRDTVKGRYVTVLAKGDQLVPAISAASIVAKVARDRYMEAQEAEYPGYGFGSHVGYGTAAHRKAIETLGVTPLHRRSFAPIAKLTQGTTKAIGDAAETAVVNFLEKAGHRIVARNWRTRYCEIDIVSEKDGVAYFTEVKYRSSATQGGGLQAITPAKLRQMRFAAEFYLARNPAITQAHLAVAAVTGNGLVEAFLEVE